MASDSHKEIAHEFLPFVRVYKDGSIDKLIDPPQVPPSLYDPDTGVSSKDICITPDISARIYIPTSILSSPDKRIPILLYFHGGGFCVGSAFSAADHRYMVSVTAAASVISISVEYRLAPDHPLPTAYDDCYEALKWVASHQAQMDGEPWIVKHGDLDRIFLGGESAGGNIAHNVAMRVGTDESSVHGVRPVGLFMAMPFFWGSEPVGLECEMVNRAERVSSRIWEFVYPECRGGIDGKEVNPFGPEIGDAVVKKIGCERILVVVAGKDELRERGKWYVDGVKKSGYEGEIELWEVEDEDHVFHIFKPECESAKELLRRLVEFIHYK